MEDKNKNVKIIHADSAAKTLWRKKWWFLIIMPIVAGISSAIILGVPRYYASDTKLAPEIATEKGGGLSSIASSFGFDLGEMASVDAINPKLYPDLMTDNKFITDLFNIEIETKDGKVRTTYFDYLCNNQKKPSWDKYVKKFLKSEKGKPATDSFDSPYSLSKEQDKIVETIKNDISISVDSKTSVITIAVQSQDPRVCRILADSVREHLQTFITEYRTTKARTDLEYYQKLTYKAEREYNDAREKYSKFADANVDVVLQSVISELEDMENDMQYKYNTYTAMQNQLHQAEAKVQEKTPVFTILKGAAEPVKPAGPKRMLFVVAMTMIAGVLLSSIFLRKNIASMFK